VIAEDHGLPVGESRAPLHVRAPFCGRRVHVSWRNVLIQVPVEAGGAGDPSVCPVDVDVCPPGDRPGHRRGWLACRLHDLAACDKPSMGSTKRNHTSPDTIRARCPVADQQGLSGSCVSSLPRPAPRVAPVPWTAPLVRVRFALSARSKPPEKGQCHDPPARIPALPGATLRR